MKVDKIKPLEVKATISADELLERTGMTREEWNDMIAKQIAEIENDDGLTDEEKGRRITRLLLISITKNNRFLLEDLANMK